MKCDMCGKDNLSLKRCNECQTVFCWNCGIGKDYPLEKEPTQVHSACPKCGNTNFEFLEKTRQ